MVFFGKLTRKMYMNISGNWMDDVTMEKLKRFGMSPK